MYEKALPCGSSINVQGKYITLIFVMNRHIAVTVKGTRERKYDKRKIGDGTKKLQRVVLIYDANSQTIKYSRNIFHLTTTQA